MCVSSLFNNEHNLNSYSSLCTMCFVLHHLPVGHCQLSSYSGSLAEPHPFIVLVVLIALLYLVVLFLFKLHRIINWVPGDRCILLLYLSFDENRNTRFCRRNVCKREMCHILQLLS